MLAVALVVDHGHFRYKLGMIAMLLEAHSTMSQHIPLHKSAVSSNGSIPSPRKHPFRFMLIIGCVLMHWVYDLVPANAMSIREFRATSMLSLCEPDVSAMFRA